MNFITLLISTAILDVAMRRGFSKYSFVILVLVLDKNKNIGKELLTIISTVEPSFNKFGEAWKYLLLGSISDKILLILHP